MNLKNCPKITRSYISFTIPLSLLLVTGCVHVSSLDTVQPIVNTVSKANQAARAIAPAGAAAPKADPKATLESAGAKTAAELQSAGLYQIPPVSKLVGAARAGKPITLSNKEVRKLAVSVLGSIHQNLFNGSVKTDVTWTPAVSARDVKGQKIDILTLMEAYYIAYSDGKFTLRDGTVLGKPTGSIVFTNGSLAGSIPNDTAQGIVQVFIEAINDSIYQTPLFYSLKQTTTYTNFWAPAPDIYPTINAKYSDSYVELYRQQNSSENDYFMKGAVPTASKFFPCYQVEVAPPGAKKPTTGLTQQEVEFIRAVSGLTAKQSQALGTLIFQTFGGASAGQFVFLHFSVGNSTTLSGVVSILLSSSSYHLSEWELTNVFLGYDGTDPTVKLMLDHYQNLLAIVTKI